MKKNLSGSEYRPESSISTITVNGAGASMKVKTATINGVVFDIDIDPNVGGSCDSPISAHPKPTIFIAEDMKTLAGLTAIVHEALHASNWHSSEEKVAQTSKDICRLLWRLGFRKGEK